jgi:hypothetical protein
VEGYSQLRFPTAKCQSIRSRVWHLLTSPRYCETINILYERNKFVIGMSEVHWLYLHLLLPPRRVQAIRDLSLIWYLGEPPKHGSTGQRRWASVWQAMALFTALEKLRVEIKLAPVWKYDWISEESRMFRDIQGVVQPPDFELVLCWPSGNRLPELPCKISRVGWYEI